MRLAFCLFKYFPYGGLQRDFLRIATEATARGHQVDVYTSEWQSDRPAELNIQIIPSKGFTNHSKRQHFVAQLQTFFAKASYDLIIGFNKMPGLDVYYAADTCYQAKMKQKYFWHRCTPRYWHSLAYEKNVFHSQTTTTILALSEAQLKEFHYYYQTPLERFHLLPPGISKDRLATDAALTIRKKLRAQFNVSEDTFLMLLIGSGFKTKGLDRALLAIADLPDQLKANTKLFVIGQDNETPFAKLASKLQITDAVQFLGGQDNVPDFLMSADVLIHPAYNENTGTVLLEALASGLPVLTTDVCGYAKYIKAADAGKIIASPFSQEALNQSLEEIICTDTSTWKTNAKQYAQQHDIYSLPQRAVDIIESLA